MKICGRRILCGLSLCLLTACSPSDTSNSRQLKSKIFARAQVIGERGAGAGQFNKPRSVAVDGDNNIFVIDTTGRAEKFSPEGKFLLSWQMPETAKGKAKGMGTDPDGNIFIVEPHYARVNLYDPSGKLLQQWGDNGTNAGQLAFPRSIAVAPNGDVWVSEYAYVERVQRFSPGGTNFVMSIGRQGDGPGEFNRAEGVCVDRAGNLYVADSCNHRIQIFSNDGKFLRQYGHPGTKPGEMSYPYDIRVDATGLQYVCEFGNSRIQVFDQNDKLVEVIGGVGSAPGMFNNPWSIAFDSKGNLLVADSLNHRVQKLWRRKELAATRNPESGMSNITPSDKLVAELSTSQSFTSMPDDGFPNSEFRIPNSR